MTERAKKLLLLYYKQSRKIRRVSGLPPLTFKAKKAGTLKNYRIYGNTETLTRSYSGSAPLSFPIVDGAVSNYRIYGNTENGESVGELVTDSQSEHYGKYAIPITNNAETANIYLDEPLTKQGDNADYIDYAEQKRYNADGTSENVSLPVMPAQSSTNSLSVGTAVQPSSVAVDVGEVVSCGDKTENLFDFGEWSKNINVNGDNSLAKGIDGITITANSNDAFTVPYAYVHEDVYKIYVKPNTNYLLSWVSNNNLFGRIYVFKNGVVDESRRINVNNAEKKYLLFDTDTNTEFVTLRFGVSNAGDSITYSKIMLNEGSTALPYEPYGYKIPVTLTADSAETTDIYLDEPLAKLGNSTDYIDYMAQKRHNSDGTESSVTLPEIAVTAGTNTLTIGTEVQPSGVEIKGRIKAAGGD